MHAGRAANLVAFDWDLLADEAWWSEGMQLCFGHSPEALEPGTDSWASRLHPQDRTRVLEGLQAVFNAGLTAWSDDYRFRCADGFHDEVLHHAHVDYDEQGLPVRIIGFIVDVAAHNETVVELRKEMDETDLALAAPRPLICGLLPDGTATFANQAAARLIGYEADEVIGRNWWDLMGSGDAAARFERLLGQSGEGETFRLETALIPKVGEPRVISWTFVRRARGDGESVEVLGIGGDMREGSSLEPEAREFVRLLAQVQRLAHLGTWQWDLAADSVRWSDELCRIFGVLPGELGATPEALLDRIHPDDREMVRNCVKRALEDGRSIEYEARIVRPNRTVRVIRTLGEAVKDRAGRPIAIVGVTQDVTEQVKSEGLAIALNSAFELIATGSPLETVLTRLIQALEEQFAELRCSVLLADDQGRLLHFAAAPSFPREFAEAVDGLDIGPSSGACGAAAFRREPVTVADISRDPLCEAFRDLAERCEIRACWSSPILATTGRVLGTICLYFRERRGPGTTERAMIENVARIAGLAIERQRVQEALEVKTGQLHAITDVILGFLQDGNWREASARLLRSALRQTSSEYGFLGVVVEGPALRILAHEGVQWDREVNREFYDNAVRTYRQQGYLEFTNFENLFGRVITSGKVVLSNEPVADPRAGGLPPGHPLLHHFLGVPIMQGADVVGMIGLANRPGGFTGTEQEKIELLTQTASILYGSYRHQQRAAELEGQLRQSQKMEAMGRLAGGIAHDFNNLLTVIGGYCEMLLEQLSPDAPLREEIREIQKAEQRAASLTNQLLTFSRRQVLRPVLLDLNAAVGNVEPMLRRLIGEDIELVTVKGDGLWKIKADPSQIEQVVLNLAVNSRDAMPNGGRITIETANVERAARSSSRPDGGQSGQSVMLAVGDTGCGMDAEVKAHLFEPFFTTKPQGRGTGLGLATVYGIVQQSGGSIVVESGVERGTVFKIYFPLAEGPEEAPDAEDLRPVAAQPGAETILLVEDEDSLRALACRVLQEAGYTVLAARNGAEALQIGQRHSAPIHLLVTDVVMPAVNGRDLAEGLKERHPETKVLYMSGYTDHVLNHHHLPESGLHFISKPFTPSAFKRKICEVLGG
ncbi:MAG: PAS domain-containing protein [Nitrospirota bacterium]